MIRILLLGRDGQVGSELQRSLAPLGEVISLDRYGNDYCGDLTNLSGIAETVIKTLPHVIVNAAAYTDVNKAETGTGRELAYLVNTDAPIYLAKLAKKIGAWFIHYSTDYVFDGTGNQAWKEIDQPNPLNIYGKTKWEGEKGIWDAGCKHLIFRTSWVHSNRKNNFVKTIIKQANEIYQNNTNLKELSLCDDCTGSPTSAELLADITAHCIGKICRSRLENFHYEVSGIYHVANSGTTSRYELARFIISHLKNIPSSIIDPLSIVKPLSTEKILSLQRSELEVNLPVRPVNSALCTDKLQYTFNLTLPSWQFGVERTLMKILQT